MFFELNTLVEIPASQLEQLNLMKLTDEDLKIAPELRGLNAGNVGDVLNNFFQHFAMVEMDGPEGESSKAS